MGVGVGVSWCCVCGDRRTDEGAKHGVPEDDARGAVRLCHTIRLCRCCGLVVWVEAVLGPAEPLRQALAQAVQL